MGYAAAMKRLKQENLEQHIKDHPDQFEAVDTGYLLKKGGNWWLSLSTMAIISKSAAIVRAL